MIARVSNRLNLLIKLNLKMMKV